MEKNYQNSVPKCPLCGKNMIPGQYCSCEGAGVIADLNSAVGVISGASKSALFRKEYEALFDKIVEAYSQDTVDVKGESHDKDV